MDAKQLREYVVIPSLMYLSPEILFTTNVVELIMGTGAVESRLQYIDQLEAGPGPAYGLFQMEAPTHDDIWQNFLIFNRPLAAKVAARSITGVFSVDAALEMAGNLYYATLMVRCHYRRVKEALPIAGDIAGLARYWKRYYNTPKGAGKEADFIKAYKELITNA